MRIVPSIPSLSRRFAVAKLGTTKIIAFDIWRAVNLEDPTQSLQSAPTRYSTEGQPVWLPIRWVIKVLQEGPLASYISVATVINGPNISGHRCGWRPLLRFFMGF